MEFILLIGYTIGIYFLGIRRGIGIMLQQEDLPDESEELLHDIEQKGIINPEQSDSDVKMMIRIDYDEKEEYFFVHEEGTHKFMAHGKTWQDVEVRLKERYPGMKFGINEDHAREIGIL